MGLDAYIIPMLDIEELKKDENLEVIVDGENGLPSIKMKGSDSSILSYSDKVLHYGRIWENSFSLLCYLHKRYKVLIGADGFFHDGGYCSYQETMILGKYYSEEECNDAFMAVYTEFACDEMLEFKEVYGLDEEDVSYIQSIRDNNMSKYRDWMYKMESKRFDEESEVIDLCLCEAELNSYLYNGVQSRIGYLLISEFLEDEKKSLLRNKLDELEKKVSDGEILIVSPPMANSNEDLPF